MATMKKLGCLIVLVVLAVPLCFFNIPTELKVSKETTYVLGPMTADGKRIDYFRAMEERFYPPEMKTDDNGYRILVQTLGVNAWQRETGDPTIGEMLFPTTEALWIQIHEKLGLDPNEKPTTPLKIETPLTLLDQSDEFQQASFWTFDDFPTLKDWLDENTAGIDLLAEAVRKPVFYIPIIREYENTSIFSPLPFAVLFRGWAQAVHARATYRLGVGDIDGAIDDIVTLHRLGRHTGRQITLLSWALGRYMEALGSSIGIGSNPNFSPTREQIERLVTELIALPPRQTFGECLEAERYLSLAVIQDMYYNPGGRCCGGTFWTRNIRWFIDINVFLERMNKHFDEWHNEHFSIDVSRPSWNPLPYLFIRSRTNLIHDTTFVVALVGQRELGRVRECKANLQLLTLALLLYEKEHGKLPDGDWREALKTAERAGGVSPPVQINFRCPSYPGLADDETTYAMVRRESGEVPTTPYTLLLVEVHPPMKMGEGDGTISEAEAKLGVRHTDAGQPMDGLGSYHSGTVVAGFRSGAVQVLSKHIKPDDLQSLLDGTAIKMP